MKKLFTIVFIFFRSGLYCQEKYVYIDGQKFRTKEFGKGDLTVIFESGMGERIIVTRPDP